MSAIPTQDDVWSFCKVGYRINSVAISVARIRGLATNVTVEDVVKVDLNWVKVVINKHFHGVTMRECVQFPTSYLWTEDFEDLERAAFAKSAQEAAAAAAAEERRREDLKEEYEVKQYLILKQKFKGTEWE